MPHADTRTTMRYGDLVTDEMEQAHKESCGAGAKWIAEWIAVTVSELKDGEGGPTDSESPCNYQWFQRFSGVLGCIR